MNVQGENIIMSEKDFNEYLAKIEKYTEMVSNGKVSAQKSLNSLVKAGICNKNKKLNSRYKAV